MLRSLYSAVSGVKAHQTYLDVTGNNIANVNTTGFKKDTTLFADQIYQMQRSASAPDNGVPIGGTNPAQVGLGVKVAAIETVHSQGSAQNTGLETDMMIQGNGFFVVRNGGGQYYTRAGAFSLDKNGNLVQQGTGNLVQGYKYRDVTDPATGLTQRVKDATISDINIPIGQKLPAKPTDLVSFRCNLCATVAPEIPNLDNIPGGVEKVLRPHDYSAYGTPTNVTYFRGAEPAPDAQGLNGPSIGDTWLDGNTLKVYRRNPGTGDPEWSTAGINQSDYTIYYGVDRADPVDDRLTTSRYYTRNDQGIAMEGPVVSKKSIVDMAGTGAPNTTPGDTNYLMPPKGGATYLDLETGIIYTANARGNEWLPVDATQDKVDANTAVAVRSNTNNQDLGNYGDKLFLLHTDGTNAMTDITGQVVMDSTNRNLFFWSPSVNTDPNGLGGEWKNYNLTESLGLRPTDAENTWSKTAPVTTTSQATIDAFAESIKANNDHTIKLTVYDSLGTPRTLEVVFRRVASFPAEPNAEPPTAAETEWDWYAYYVDDDSNQLHQYGEGAGTLVFGDDGLLRRTYYYEPNPLTPDPNGTSAGAQPEYNWTVVEKWISGNTDAEKARVEADANKKTGVVVADFNTSGAEGEVENTVPPTYESNLITLDFLGDLYAQAVGTESEAIDGVTQFASTTTTKARYQNGYAMGVLNDWSVSQTGTITGKYSNGQNLPIAQVAVATFANDAGLEKVGDTLFAESVNSGMAEIQGGMEGSAGSVISNTLEMSNVDLTEEFVNLIRAQRGLQANSRVVTTSDQVLEELINLKR